jgi:predicted aspartyl protease
VYLLLPYREEGNPAVLRPTVDVRLEYGETGDWTLRALIDTGSPITVFDRGAADAVGVRYDYAGAQTGMIRMLGGHWAVQFEDVHLSLVVDAEYEWTARVAFVRSPELQMPFQGVLGTEGFLDKFAVTFNKYYDYFVLERPDDFHDRVGGPLAADPVAAYDPQWHRPGD